MSQQKKGWISLLGIPVVFGIFLILGGLLFGREAVSEESDSQQAAAEESETVSDVSLIEGMCGDGVAYTYNRDTQVLTLSGEGATWDFSLHWKVEGEKGSDVEVPWAEYKTQIKRIELEGGIRKLGSGAFAGCSGLKSVGWGELKEIGDHCFYDCGMMRVQLPVTITSVEPYAFSNCGKLGEVVLPDSLQVLTIGTFTGTPVESIRIGAGTELKEVFYQVGYNPFFETTREGEGIGRQEHLVIKGYVGSFAEDFARRYQIPFRTLGYVDGYTVEGQCGDEAYWSLDLSQGIMTIHGEGDTWNYGNLDDEYAEQDQYADYFVPWHGYRGGIKKVVIEDGIDTIGMRLFADCRNLKEVDWGSVETISVCSFQNTGLEAVVLPESVRGIWDYSFSWCESLEEIVIPESVEEVAFPFAGSTELKKVVFEGNPEIYGEWSEEDEDSSGSIFYERDYGFRNEELVIYCRDDADLVKSYAELAGETLKIIEE